MRKNKKRFQALWIAVFVILASVMTSIPEGRYVFAAEAIEVDMAGALRTCLNPESEENGIYIKLAGDIMLGSDDFSNGTPAFSLGEKAKNVILDLNGHHIEAGYSTSNLPLFYNGYNGNTFTITDTSSAANGYLTSANGGKCIQTEGGTLNIEGGSFQNAAQCLDVSNTTVNISGGSFETDGNGTTDVALLISGDNTKVTITGGTFTSKHGTIWVMDRVENGSELNIKGGTITAKENGSTAGYACYVGGQCEVDISGGTFNLEPAEGSARKGSSLLFGTNVTDDLVNISGGTFNGRIARAISDTADANYEVFYGNENSLGILGDGCVFTDNTFYLQHPDYKVYFTQDEVEVVSGSLVKFNTGRSYMETYTDEESIQADNADYYSLDPVSVGTDGIPYSNTDSNVIPAVDTSRVTDGNTYTFYRWYDEDGKAYDTVDEFIAAGEWNDAGRTVTLSAGWEAQTGTRDGLESAVNNNTTVKSILVSQDIPLNEAVAEESAGTTERILNLDGHTISSTDSDTAALVLKGKWNIKNGTITGINQPCLEIGGTATIENMDCLSNATCAVKFGSGLSENRIISGTFEATGEEGHALCITDANQTVIVADMKELFGDSYASSTGIITDDNGNIHLAASRLIVSKSPITYIGNGTDTDLGSYVYGESVPTSTQIISNEKYVGDIVITGVSVDNSVFTVTGAGEPKYLRGGVSRDENSYSYTVGVAENTDAGNYTGTVTISYTKMDGSTGKYIQKLSLTVTPKQLTIAESVVTKEKVYDKTTTAQVQAGTLAGVLDGDDVTVTATAAYDSADAGSGKKITVSYNLDGQDKGNYLAPVNEVILDGIINKADGVASVSMPDYHVGETAPAAVLTSETNKTTDATCYYKQKGASDDTYTKSLPTKEGNYTIKAVFAENQNYNAVEVQTDFAVSYIDTPQTAYTLSGTMGQDGWYTSEVVIYPAQGYLISDSADGVFASSYTVKATAEPIICLKNENGAVTRPIQVEKLLIDTGMPQIKDETGKKGWDVIKDEVDKSKDGNTVVVEMNGSSVVPGDVFNEIKGKDVTIVFDMGGGITWSVNGQSITGDRIGDIDFSVSVDTNTIPVDVINNVTGERYSKQISLAYDGEFGFTAVLSINMDKKNAGLYANLFYYNEKTGKLEFICADKIAEDGTTELTFTHASDYTIVIDKAPNKDNAPDTGDRTPVVWLFVLIVISVTGLTFAVKKGRIKALIK